MDFDPEAPNEGEEWKEPKKPKALELGNNAATILEARVIAEAGKGRIREEAKIWTLSDEHFVQVVEWMLARLPSRRVEELCASELQLPPAKIPGRQAQSTFWRDFSPFWLVARRRQNVRTVESINAEIEAAPLNVDKALRDEIKQLCWEVLQNPNPPEKLVKTLVNATLKLRDQDDRAEDREFNREKFAAAQRGKIESGLEALRVEIVGNPAAMAAWENLKGALAP